VGGSVHNIQKNIDA